MSDQDESRDDKIQKIVESEIKKLKDLGIKVIQAKLAETVSEKMNNEAWTCFIEKQPSQLKWFEKP